MEYRSGITGQVIGRLRVQAGLSQAELAAQAGLARSHLSMIENGTKNPNVDTLWRIAAALHLPLSELFRQVEAEHRRAER